MASCFFLAWALRHQIRFNWICFVTVWNVFFCCSRTGMMQNFETDKNHVYIYIYIYLDLPYGTYFCRCSETLELSPFLRQNPVPENKCHCEILWEIVSPRSRVFLPFGGAFSPLKNWFGSYNIYIYIYIDIYQNKLWFAQKGRSCAKLCKTYSLGKRQQLSPLWKRQDEAGICIKTMFPGRLGDFKAVASSCCQMCQPEGIKAHQSNAIVWSRNC